MSLSASLRPTLFSGWMHCEFENLANLPSSLSNSIYRVCVVRVRVVRVWGDEDE